MEGGKCMDCRLRDIKDGDEDGIGGGENEEEVRDGNNMDDGEEGELVPLVSEEDGKFTLVTRRDLDSLHPDTERKLELIARRYADLMSFPNNDGVSGRIGELEDHGDFEEAEDEESDDLASSNANEDEAPELIDEEVQSGKAKDKPDLATPEKLVEMMKRMVIRKQIKLFGIDADQEEARYITPEESTPTKTKSAGIDPEDEGRTENIPEEISPNEIETINNPHEHEIRATSRDREQKGPKVSERPKPIPTQCNSRCKAEAQSQSLQTHLNELSREHEGLKDQIIVLNDNVRLIMDLMTNSNPSHAWLAVNSAPVLKVKNATIDSLAATLTDRLKEAEGRLARYEAWDHGLHRLVEQESLDIVGMERLREVLKERDEYRNRCRGEQFERVRSHVREDCELAIGSLLVDNKWTIQN